MVKWTAAVRQVKVQARKTERSKLGNLRDSRVSKPALKRYEKAVEYFFEAIKRQGEQLVDMDCQLDAQVCEHIERLWAEGEVRALAEDLLSGLKHHVPALKGKLVEAWRLVTV